MNIIPIYLRGVFSHAPLAPSGRGLTFCGKIWRRIKRFEFGDAVLIAPANYYAATLVWPGVFYPRSKILPMFAHGFIWAVIKTESWTRLCVPPKYWILRFDWMHGPKGTCLSLKSTFRHAFCFTGVHRSIVFLLLRICISHSHTTGI